MAKYDGLRLINQICFPLYAASKEVIRKYTPLLAEFDLTYTQYITMMVMWEKEQISVKELGNCLFLDSGTITPVLKSLEKKGYVSRTRSKEDERVLIASITKKGMDLQDSLIDLPNKIASCVSLDEQEAKTLYNLLYKLLNS